MIEFDNKTLIILIVGIISVLGLLYNQIDIANFGVGGLVGYLTKDVSEKVIDYMKTDNTEVECCGELSEDKC